VGMGWSAGDQPSLALLPFPAAFGCRHLLAPCTSAPWTSVPVIFRFRSVRPATAFASSKLLPAAHDEEVDHQRKRDARIVEWQARDGPAFNHAKGISGRQTSQSCKYHNFYGFCPIVMPLSYIGPILSDILTA
jgi:hypothetical protein